MLAELKDRIKNERLTKGLNQPELAKILNVTKQTVSNWENGNRIPDTITLVKLADYFNVTTDYLLCRTANRQSFILHETTIDGMNIELHQTKDIDANEISEREKQELAEMAKKIYDALKKE